MKNTKRGLTIIELLLAMVLLAVIMAAVSAIFSVALKNYHFSFAQSNTQREVNFVTDLISRDTKQAVEIPESYNGNNRSEDYLILALPAIDEEENFLYDGGGNLQKDYIVYYLNGQNLNKVVFAQTNSSRYSEDSSEKEILENVSELSFSYSPDGPGYETRKVDTAITVSRLISKTNLTVTSQNSGVKRNYE